VEERADRLTEDSKLGSGDRQPRSSV